MTVLGLVDQSLYHRSVVEHAAWAASSAKTSLEITHVISPSELLMNRMPTHPGGAVIRANDMTQGEELAALRMRGEEILTESRALAEASGAANISTRLEEGPLLSVAEQVSREAKLVVIGKRGEHADLARLPLGAHVEHVGRTSSVPAVVVSRTFRPVERLMLAFDLDEDSRAAADLLADGGFVPPMPALILHVGTETEELRTAMAAAAQRLNDAGFAVTIEIVEGIAQHIIPQRAVTDGSGLVVMGAFGQSRLKSLLFGSLTREVMRACQTPVLLAA